MTKKEINASHVHQAPAPANAAEIPYTSELVRKGIHLLSLLIPVCYSFMDRNLILALLVPMTAITIAVDVLSKLDTPCRQWIQFVLGSILRPHEKGKRKTLNGASWVMLASVAIIAIFPKIIAITGITGLIICDTSAALVGRKFGRIRFWGKSLEGSLAFLISGLIAVAFIGNAAAMPLYYYTSGFVAVSLATIAELFSKKAHLDDNLTIPFTICIVQTVANHYFTFL